MVKEYCYGAEEEATKIFIDIYKNRPFGFEWLEYKSILKYFLNFEKYEDFKGFVYESGGEIIGFCFGRVNNIFATKKYYINEFFVKRDLQHNGVGTKFIQEIESKLASDEIYVIELNTDKRIYAYDFYKKNGFIETENIVQMVKISKDFVKTKNVSVKTRD